MQSRGVTQVCRTTKNGVQHGPGCAGCEHTHLMDDGNSSVGCIWKRIWPSRAPRWAQNFSSKAFQIVLLERQVQAVPCCCVWLGALHEDPCCVIYVDHGGMIHARKPQQVHSAKMLLTSILHGVRGSLGHSARALDRGGTSDARESVRQVGGSSPCAQQLAAPSDIRNRERDAHHDFRRPRYYWHLGGRRSRSNRSHG
jgi:hypothetical protein